MGVEHIYSGQATFFAIHTFIVLNEADRVLGGSAEEMLDVVSSVPGWPVNSRDGRGGGCSCACVWGWSFLCAHVTGAILLDTSPERSQGKHPLVDHA